MRLKLYIKGNEIIIEDIKRCGLFRRMIGLMFSRRERANALLFDFGENRVGIHSFFVFFPFLAIWLDKKNRVVDYKIIYPFTLFITSNKKFSRLIEVPLNKKYKEIFTYFKINWIRGT